MSKPYKLKLYKVVKVLRESGQYSQWRHFEAGDIMIVEVDLRYSEPIVHVRRLANYEQTNIYTTLGRKLEKALTRFELEEL